MVILRDIFKEINMQDYIIVYNSHREIKSVQSIYYQNIGDHLSFIQDSSEYAEQLFYNFSGSCLIISSELNNKRIDAIEPTFSILVTTNPKLLFARVVKKFFSNKIKQYLIHPSVVMENNVSIGEGTTIDGNVIIYEGVQIGKNCEIKAGAVLGGNGFGHSKTKDGSWENIVHIGSLIIGDNVLIGSNTCIDRGTLDNTIIHDGVKIDNNVHIAHNVIIGSNTLIIANSMIAGSVVIGDNCWISPMVSIRDQIVVGRNVMIGMGSVVVKNIPDDSRVKGVPAKPF